MNCDLLRLGLVKYGIRLYKTQFLFRDLNDRLNGTHLFNVLLQRRVFSFQMGGLALPAECDHMAALGVQPWGGAYIHDEATLSEALACGVTLITCNNPDVILDLLRKKGKHA